MFSIDIFHLFTLQWALDTIVLHLVVYYVSRAPAVDERFSIFHHVCTRAIKSRSRRGIYVM
jgi:hypothetical protein